MRPFLELLRECEERGIVLGLRFGGTPAFIDEHGAMTPDLRAELERRLPNVAVYLRLKDGCCVHLLHPEVCPVCNGSVE